MTYGEFTAAVLDLEQAAMKLAEATGKRAEIERRHEAEKEEARKEQQAAHDALLSVRGRVLKARPA